MNNFTKEDIKNGAIVETRNGRRYLKVDDTLLRLDMSGRFTLLSGYTDYLYSKYAKKYDIIKCLNPKENIFYKNACNCAVNDIKNINIEWTWERKEEENE